MTGGAGFLGKAVCARLTAAGVRNFFIPCRSDYDLTQSPDVVRMYKDVRPQVVIHLAAEVGGIGANQKNPGRFFYSNMAMGLHLIEAGRLHGVQKFVQIGSVCAYPKHCPVPFMESDLWSGYPEETNAAYGIAKRSLAVMLDAYYHQYGFQSVYLVPANLYGPHDNFDLQTSHVVPALIRKFCDAVEQGESVVTCWGSGSSTREFLYVEDAAEAIMRAAEVLNDPTPVNIGTGCEIRISELARLIARLAGFHGTIGWDAHRPDGQPRRAVSTEKADRLLDWKAATPLETGLQKTIQWWRSCGQSRTAERAAPQLRSQARAIGRQTTL